MNNNVKIYCEDFDKPMNGKVVSESNHRLEVSLNDGGEPILFYKVGKNTFLCNKGGYDFTIRRKVLTNVK
jgi:hypothetical protein